MHTNPHTHTHTKNYKQICEHSSQKQIIIVGHQILHINKLPSIIHFQILMKLNILHVATKIFVPKKIPHSHAVNHLRKTLVPSLVKFITPYVPCLFPHQGNTPFNKRDGKCNRFSLYVHGPQEENKYLSITHCELVLKGSIRNVSHERQAARLKLASDIHLITSFTKRNV